MTLTPTLKSIEDLFKKLEREWQRAHDAEKEIDLADHVYNFCVTAQSMKDYFFETLLIVKKPLYHKEWNENKFLLAAKEIANMSKHFTLRDTRTGKPRKAKTKDVKLTTKKSTVMQLNVSDEKIDLQEKPVTKPDLMIRLEDQEEWWSLWDFKSEVIAYWQKLLIETRLITVPVVHGSERDVGRDRV